MARKVISVSINEEDLKFLEENPDLSPSKILRTAIYHLRENTTALKERLLVYQKKMEVMQKHILDQGDVILLKEKKIAKLQGKEILVDDGKNKKLI